MVWRGFAGIGCTGRLVREEGDEEQAVGGAVQRRSAPPSGGCEQGPGQRIPGGVGESGRTVE